MYNIRAILIAIAIFGISQCFGNVIPSTTRHGDFNSYFLYTRNNPREPIKILPTVSGLPATSVFKAHTAILVHGHLGTALDSLNPVVKDAFISSSDLNVIVLDWSIYSSQVYSNAVHAVPGVGTALAEFIQLLVQNNRVSLDRLHLVGFDLGAHVVGFAGRTLSGKIARITGLDPSASEWDQSPHRLQSTDAHYVEVIHTDGTGIGSNGINTVMGHVDFFPNGGSSQPGCFTHSCSHNRAWELFASSLTHNQLTGNQCNSYTQLNLNLCRGYMLAMGNNDYVKYGSGIFRGNTGKTYPY